MRRVALFVRRCAAYGVDCAAIAAYALALAAVSLTVAPDAQLSKAGGYALGLATLTAPVVLVFSVLEARLGVSPGKAFTGLRVRSGAARPGFAVSLTRNGIKFLPWETAHIGIWLTPGQPFVDPPGLMSLGLMSVAMGAVGIQALLVALTGAGVHDRAAGLRVAAVR
jgi:hypothetical protein